MAGKPAPIQRLSRRYAAPLKQDPATASKRRGRRNKRIDPVMKRILQEMQKPHQDQPTR
jgi:hypothetical protein